MSDCSLTDDPEGVGPVAVGLQPRRGRVHRAEDAGRGRDRGAVGTP